MADTLSAGSRKGGFGRLTRMKMTGIWEGKRMKEENIRRLQEILDKAVDNKSKEVMTV